MMSCSWWIRHIVRVGTVVCGGILIIAAVAYWYRQNRMFDQVKQQAQEMLNTSVEQMNDKFVRLQKIGDTIAQELTQGTLTQDQDIRNRLRSVAKQNPDVFGVGVAFEPYAFSSDRRLYAPYITEGQDGLVYEPLQESYDYTQADWYNKAFQQGAYWMDPLYGKAAGVRIVDYVTPFYTNEKKSEMRGVVYVDYSLQRVSDLIAQLEIGKTGYGFIISDTGEIVAHPDDQFLQDEYTIFDLADAHNSPKLHRIGTEMTQSDASHGYYQYVDPLSGKPSYIFYQKIPATDWTLCVNFVQEEVIGSRLPLYHHIVFLLIMCVASTIGVLSWGLRIWHGERLHLSLWSTFTSLVLIVGIGVMWYMHIMFQPDPQGNNTVISSITGLRRFLKNVPESWDQIRMGVVLDYLDFHDMSTVKLLGSCWQIIPQSVPESARGFSFLDGTFDVKTLREKTSYKTDMFVHRWYFNVLMQQDFQYRQFPFDRKHIQIPLVLERDYGPHIIIPDLSAYTLTIPSALPGVHDAVNTQKWSPVASYYSYHAFDPIYPEVDDSADDRAQTQYRLYYNITLQRVFVYHLMTYALPLLVGLLAIYLTLISIFPPAHASYPPHVKETLAPIGMFVSVVFVLVTIHASLRNVLSGQPIFYLEYFYLTAYALILAALGVAQGSIFRSQWRFITYEDGIFPKILYWPVWFISLFIVTVTIL